MGSCSGRLAAPPFARARRAVSIEDLTKSGEVVAFVTEGCAFCTRTVAALREAGVEPKVIGVDTSSQLKGDLMRYSDMFSFPQVWVKGVFVGGCNDGGLGGVLPLLASGKIQEMLGCPLGHLSI